MPCGMSDAAPTQPNLVCYGDNLDIPRRSIDNESVDFVYLGPPFNLSAECHIQFADMSGERVRAQIKTCEDSWKWAVEVAQEYAAVHAGHDGTNARQKRREVHMRNNHSEDISNLEEEQARFLRPGPVTL
jgi:hypothetical protein